MHCPRTEPSPPWQEAGNPPSEPWYCFCVFISYQNAAGQYYNVRACLKQNMDLRFYYCLLLSPSKYSCPGSNAGWAWKNRFLLNNAFIFKRDPWRENLNFYNLQLNFPRNQIKNTLSNMCSSLGIVTKSWSEYFMHFWCSFPEFYVKLRALFLPISH